MCFDAHSDNELISYRLMRIGHKLNNMQFFFYSLATLFGPSSARERLAYAIFVIIITIVVVIFFSPRSTEALADLSVFPS